MQTMATVQRTELKRNQIQMSKGALVLLCVVVALLSGSIGFVAHHRSGASSTDAASVPPNLDTCIVPSAPTVVPPRGTFTQNRNQAIQAIYSQLGNNAAALRAGIFYLQGGADEMWYYSDTDKLFRQESNFRYLTGFEMPGLNNQTAEIVMVGEVVAGQATQTSYLFVQECDAFCQVWNGEGFTLEQLRDKYEVENVYFRSQMTQILNQFVMNGRSQTYTMPGVMWERCAARGLLQPLATNRVLLQRTALPAARSIKNAGEMTLMRISSQVSAEAHKMIMSRANLYNWEYSVQAEFEGLSAACGHVTQSYLSIAPASVRTAVLHYNSNERPINRSIDMVLLDAGSEFFGYGTDITRTWPVSGTFTQEQRQIYNAVFRAQSASLALVRDGASWTDVSRAAIVAMVQALIEIGIVFGPLDQALQAGVNQVFYPHGLGHYVGLDVHDSRYLGLNILRSGMVITIEPGCYFIPIQVTNARNNPLRAPFLNFTKINEFMGASTSLGGVRIEDMIYITPTGLELMSAAAPRSVADIESTMATGKFYPSQDDYFQPWLVYENQEDIQRAIATSQDPDLIKLLENVDTMMLEPLV